MFDLFDDYITDSMTLLDTSKFDEKVITKEIEQFLQSGDQFNLRKYNKFKIGGLKRTGSFTRTNSKRDREDK